MSFNVLLIKNNMRFFSFGKFSRHKKIEFSCLILMWDNFSLTNVLKVYKIYINNIKEQPNNLSFNSRKHTFTNFL